MVKNRNINCGSILLAVFWAYLITGMPAGASAAESICAEVKIEIRQELTLERQAFDAHMKINNGLSQSSLQDVEVEVSFADEEGNPVEASSDPDSSTATFFIRKDSEGFSEPAKNGDGSWNINDVDPSSIADLHWLIIPTTGAANAQPDGKIYYVGAKLHYTLGGEEYVTEVTPDYIFVKPLPELALDYFLTEQVYGDDAFTEKTEPPVPFSLGVRRRNFGDNTAYDLQIDSAQPKIVENQQGLLIGFSITGCQVNGLPAAETLLADFGDIEPDGVGVARWIMECSLSGKFTEFEATMTHADELGGELTSLIKQDDVNTHLLLKDVLVDLPGKDDIRDFLVRDDSILEVYESDGTKTETLDQSGDSSIEDEQHSGSRHTYKVSTPTSSGFIYFKLTDPENGEKNLIKAIRGDGKQIKPPNAWLSKERKDPPSAGWTYFFNLFDVDSTGSYTFVFDDAAALNQPPNLQHIPDKFLAEEEQLSFLVEASDPDGTIPELFVSNLPAGADFVDQGDGSAKFEWTPAVGQTGTYSLLFRAFDGELEDEKKMTITVNPVDDTDGDGLKDDWERKYFGDLSRDGTGDYDGDGISDLDEFLNGSDPTETNLAGPCPPEIVSPADKAETTELSPELVIKNSRDPDGDALRYDFEVFQDARLTKRVAHTENVTETAETTAWTVPVTLNDNHTYYWRVRAFDGSAYSLWTYGCFFVNTANDPPGPFNISFPADGSYTDSLTPVLEVTNSSDIDGDVLVYGFEVYEDSGLSLPVTEVSALSEGDNGTTAWTIGTSLEEGAQYFWRASVRDPDGARAVTETGSFTVSLANQAPAAPAISSPSNGGTISADHLDLIVTNATDPNNDPLLYDFQVDTSVTFDSPDLMTATGLAEGSETTAWSVSGLKDNTTYFWRAKAGDGYAGSPWVTGRFLVDLANNAPSLPVCKNPGEGAWVNVLVPELAVCPVDDPDKDSIVYLFEVYEDSSGKNLVASGESAGNTFVPSFDLDNHTRYFWRVMATDEHGADSGWTDMWGFFVHQTNRPPVISGTPVTSVDEDTEYKFIPTVEDNDPGDTLTFSVTNKPEWAVFDAATGALTGTPTNDDIGTTTNIIITVSDAMGASDSLAPFDLTVVNVNDAPEISGTPAESVDEDTSYDFTPTAVDVDAGDSLVFSITNKPSWASFDTETGKLSGVPENEHVGVTADIVITVTDAAGASDSLAPFDLTVINVNDPPVAVNDNYILKEDTPLVINAPGVLANDIDVDVGDILNAGLLEDVSHGSLALNPDGSFNYIPDQNYFGADSFYYLATDGMIDSNRSMAALNVTPVNDIPAISSIDDCVMIENTAITGLNFTVRDVESEAEDLDLSVTSSDSSLIPEKNISFGGTGTDRTLAIIPAENQHGMAELTITVTDPGNASSAETFRVEVTPKTDPPFVRYFILNPKLLSGDLQVISLEDDNHVFAKTEAFDLDRYESGSINAADLKQGEAVRGTGHFGISGSAENTGMPVPESFAGRKFVVPHVRGRHTYFIFSPYGRASVTVDLGARIENISLAKNEVREFAAGNDNTISAIVTSDMPVLMSHVSRCTLGFINITMDAFPIAPIGSDLWGVRLDATYIGALEDDTDVIVFRADGTRETMTLQAGSRKRLGRRSHGIGRHRHPLMPDRPVHIKSDKPVAAVQANDKWLDGSATVLLDGTYLAKRYAIPVDAKSVTAVCPYEDTVLMLYDSSKRRYQPPGIKEDPITAVCGRSGDTPASVDFGPGSAFGSIDAGAFLESSKPVYLIFETDRPFSEERNILGAGYQEEASGLVSGVNHFVIDPALAGGNLKVVSLARNNVRGD